MEGKIEFIINEPKGLKEEMQNVKGIVLETRNLVEPLAKRVSNPEEKQELIEGKMTSLKEENVRLQEQMDNIENYSQKK